MRQHRLAFKWLVFIFYGISIPNAVYCEKEKPQWSKPEQSIQNNDWVPVQGKCPTCRLNRDLESQSTNEQLGDVLTPPKSQSVTSVPPAAVQPPQQLQFSVNKQPRILPFASSFPQYNSPFQNTDGKQFPQQTKLAQESQKQFYQFESPYVKQQYSLPTQQLIPQSPIISQSSIPQQRFPLVEPYPFTLPLKSVDATTTPRILYQPKIRFPDNDPPKLIPNNKITSQSSDEIQLLYVPIEATQRGRKNMKEIYQQNQYQQNQYQPNQYQQNQYQQNQYQQNQYQQNQYQPSLPHGFIAPQYNFQYSPIPKQPESQFYFPSNIPPATNYLQLNPAAQPQRPETIYTNFTKSLLQPYFTINGLYSQLPQVQPVPNKQPEIPYYNVLQPGLFDANPVKPPEQVFKVPQPLQSRLQPVPAPGGPFVQSSIPNTISTFEDVYTPTTTEATKSTDYATEGKGLGGSESPNKVQDFGYQFVTSNPQTSASQNQNFISDNTITTLPQSSPQYSLLTSKIPQKTSQAPFEETTNTNYPVPHQPPLSFYMEKVHNPKINDVLYLLKDAKTIPVLDTVETDPPQVFVGPSELPPPKGYIKFELPYLSSLDYNRIERMIDRLPFFVAPLNFKPPPGYSKIPFPAPHIGSVVLSNNTILQESLHEKPFDQKYKQLTTQSFSASPELSTITPQLTSQINSLLETPSPAVPVELTSFKNLVPVPAEPVTSKNYGSPTEKITKKPVTNLHRSSTTTPEPSKRTSNRLRKPIYRGYPTSTSTQSSNPQEVTSTTESAEKYYTQTSKENNDNYVEFTAKGKFNINNSNENVVSSNPPSSASTYQISSGISPTHQSQADYSNFFSKFEQNVPIQNVPAQKDNIYETQNQNADFYSTANIHGNVDGQNYPFYNPQSTAGDTKSITTVSQTSNTEPESTQSANFNFGNIKPLSQYNHNNPYNKEESRHQVNNTESLATRTTNQPSPTNANEFNFWTQNQFYKVNPNAVDYFSSTTNYPPPEIQETSSAIPETTYPTRSTTAVYQPEPNFTEQSKESTSLSTEYVEPTSSTTHRPRLKQRIYPNRYHQSKHTSTEKENVESQTHKTNTRLSTASESTYESSSPSLEMLSQSTENHESSTRAEIKPHRRRRPIRPTTSNIVTPVTETSSSTSRSLRTRPTRHPGSVTERYRPRRPTTSSESTETLNSEWSSYNSFVPSAPASNEISVPAESSQTSEHKYSSSSWTDSSSIQQIPEISSTTDSGYTKSSADGGSVTENTPWLSSPSKQSESSIYSYEAHSPSGQNQFTVENTIENQTEIASERKDESYHSELKNTYRNKPPQSTYYEEPTSTASSSSEVKENSSDEPTSQSDDKTYSQDAKKDRFSAEGQKKAYDPQDEKKAGKRRLAFVRRFRVRPHDVLETAESQNLGRLTENSLQSSDSKVLSKTEEKTDLKPAKPSTVVVGSSTTDEYVAPTEAITDKEEDEATTSPTTSSSTSSTTSSNGIDEYAMQNDFAQMLSEFLNSNDHSTKTVNNLERNNISTENSISYILSLSNDNGPSIISNSSSAIVSPTSFPSSPEVTSADDVITITNSPITNTEFAENSTTTEEVAGTQVPDRSLPTSTTTEISLETEICYRGKCVKTKKSKASDLLPVE